MRKLTGEAAVMRAVTDLLAAKKIFVLRCNAGDRFGETNGRKWRIKGHAPGTADLLALPEVREGFGSSCPCCHRIMTVYIHHKIPVWIELKAPGKKQSEDQRRFQEEAEDREETYLLVDNVDTLINWLKERGL